MKKEGRNYDFGRIKMNTGFSTQEISFPLLTSTCKDSFLQEITMLQ